MCVFRIGFGASNICYELDGNAVRIKSPPPLHQPTSQPVKPPQSSLPDAIARTPQSAHKLVDNELEVRFRDWLSGIEHHIIMQFTQSNTMPKPIDSYGAKIIDNHSIIVSLQCITSIIHVVMVIATKWPAIHQQKTCPTNLEFTHMDANMRDAQQRIPEIHILHFAWWMKDTIVRRFAQTIYDAFMRMVQLCFACKCCVRPTRLFDAVCKTKFVVHLRTQSPTTRHSQQRFMYVNGFVCENASGFPAQRVEYYIYARSMNVLILFIWCLNMNIWFARNIFVGCVLHI